MASALPLTSGPGEAASAAAALRAHPVHAQELQCLWDEIQKLQEDMARAAEVQQLAQLERHSFLVQEVKELRQVCWGILLLFWGSTRLSWEHVGAPGGSPLGRAQVVPPFCLPAVLGGDGGCEAAAGKGGECPDSAHVGAVTGSGR